MYDNSQCDFIDCSNNKHKMNNNEFLSQQLDHFSWAKIHFTKQNIN